MDDDNIEEHMFFPPGMPEEMQKNIANHLREHRDNQMVYRHQVTYFLDSLNEEQLAVFRDMLSTLESQDNAGLTGYYQGLVSMILVQKHGHCAACGGKHDDELRKIANEGKEDQPEQSEATTSPQPWPNLITGLDEETRQNLREYRLNLVTNDYPKVVCADCGMVYQSLEDRMLKAPEDCVGCIQKEKWG